MNGLEPVAPPEILEAILADDLKAPRTDRVPIITWLIVAFVLGLISPLIYLYFGIIAPHLQAAGYISSFGGQADWMIDNSNWKTLGSTNVSFARNRWTLTHHFGRLDLEALQGLIHLEELTLEVGRDLVPDDFRILHRLPDLKQLDLMPGQQVFGAQANTSALTDEGLAVISESRTIKNLAVADSYITDEGLDHLARMNQLEYLDLSDTAITEVGLAKLKPLVNLRSLGLSGTKVTGAGATAFQSSMPSLQHIDNSLPTFRRTR